MKSEYSYIDADLAQLKSIYDECINSTHLFT